MSSHQNSNEFQRLVLRSSQETELTHTTTPTVNYQCKQMGKQQITTPLFMAQRAPHVRLIHLILQQARSYIIPFFSPLDTQERSCKSPHCISIRRLTTIGLISIRRLPSHAIMLLEFLLRNGPCFPICRSSHEFCLYV